MSKEPKLGDYMLVNGEKIARPEVMKLVKMLCNDAKQIAGAFYEQNRSEKFRANWPIDTVFVDCNWRHFIEATRSYYAELLGAPDHLVSPYDKDRMFTAIALYDQIEAAAPDKFSGIQMTPNTQQFVGDPYENRKIKADYGKHSNTFKELLMARSRFH